jgi:hypothetical protein
VDVRGIWVWFAAIVLAACSRGGQAMGQSLWRPAFPDRSMVVFIDQARMQTTAGVATVWALAVPPKLTPSPVGQFSRIESQERFDCAARLHQTLAVEYFSADGRLIFKGLPSGAKDAVAPGSAFDYMMKAACDGDFESGDIFADKAGAIAFGRAWAQSYDDLPPVVAHAVPAMQAEPPPPTLTDLALPDGRLGGVTAIPQQMSFLDLDHIVRHGDKISIVIYWVYPPGGIVSDPGATQYVNRVVLDCAARTFQDLGGLDFNDNDVLDLWLPKSVAAQPLTANTTFAATAKLLCDGAFGPPTNIVLGHAAAFELGRRTLANKPLLDSMPKFDPAAGQ